MLTGIGLSRVRKCLLRMKEGGSEIQPCSKLTGTSCIGGLNREPFQGSAAPS